MRNHNDKLSGAGPLSQNKIADVSRGPLGDWL